ncbi:hypothetical protein AVEN_149026-1 [Araneus ventricosus]|uniref:Uncharacterized protein n=1 Tax=Araneus ventricosus TaxID=182803 RepID=A0A4Y2T3R6_ARAVE|nr:hypothetical protein AVEN_149026-1 [Araneus ventricosus]
MESQVFYLADTYTAPFVILKLRKNSRSLRSHSANCFLNNASQLRVTEQPGKRHCFLDIVPARERTRIGPNDILLTPRRSWGSTERKMGNTSAAFWKRDDTIPLSAHTVNNSAGEIHEFD